METKFVIKPAKALKSVKLLASKYESAIKLGLLTSGGCCQDFLPQYANWFSVKIV